MATKKEPKSLAVFGPNARGKSSLVDSFEFYFSKDATLERLGMRARDTNAGPKAIEHVKARSEGIPTLVHFWFDFKGNHDDAARHFATPMPETAKQVLSTARIPFVIRGYELRNFVEQKTPGDQYKELVQWFGLDRLLDTQKNLRTLKRKVKERSESTSEADERTRDLLSVTSGKVDKWNGQKVCNWLNNEVLASLDSSLTFTELSDRDPAIDILTAQAKAEQEKLGLTSLRNISRLLVALFSSLGGTDKEQTGDIPTFEQAVARLRKAEFQEEAERSRASSAVFNQIWTEAEILFNSSDELESCPVCDVDLGSGPHGSQGGVLVSITKKLTGLRTYRESKKELSLSTKEVETFDRLPKEQHEACK